MKRFLHILGAALFVLAVLSALLFLLAQISPFFATVGEHASWIALLGTVFLTGTLCTVIFFLIPFLKNDTPVPHWRFIQQARWLIRRKEMPLFFC